VGRGKEEREYTCAWLAQEVAGKFTWSEKPLGVQDCNGIEAQQTKNKQTTQRKHHCQALQQQAFQQINTFLSL
jgi:hypothetical protein